jgi:SAM-dependent methyltransferase
MLDKWLSELEGQERATLTKDVLLWPGTPIKQLQDQIIQMQGAGDLGDVFFARPKQIIDELHRLRLAGQIPHDFSILDICCGDGLVLWKIKKEFPGAYCYGIDINKNVPDTHAMVQNDGVKLYRVSIQRLFVSIPPQIFDVATMLNTYRGWHSAILRGSEQTLPEQADVWLAKNSFHSIVTMNADQIVAWSDREGFSIIGKGEQDSRMARVTWSR